MKVEISKKDLITMVKKEVCNSKQDERAFLSKYKVPGRSKLAPIGQFAYGNAAEDYLLSLSEKDILRIFNEVNHHGWYGKVALKGVDDGP
jgi:hypothetical protein